MTHPGTPSPSTSSGRPEAVEDSRVHDVVVVGGGPSGSACAYWLADAGWDVVLVEKKHFPREKTCGDGLTPRAVRQLSDMGLSGALAGAHRFDGLRACAYGMSIEMPWPDHPAFPPVGYVITRHDLDQIVAERAAKAGATVWEGAEAIGPILDPATAGHVGGAGTSAEVLPSCAGANVLDRDAGRQREVRARYTVVADGANSRFGRALGTSRDRDYPLGMALRGYFRSPRHDEPFIESHLDIRDASGAVVPGYGWVFPMGDGRVNAGVGLLSVEGRWKGANTTQLMEAFIGWAPRSWGLSHKTLCGPPTGGKLPMGLSVRPRIGPNVLVIGDAAGSVNPFNGEGIAYGYETGRLAAACVARALSGEGVHALVDYESQLQAAYGLYYRMAREFVRLISRPELMQICVRSGMHSRSVMEWLLRIMANLVRPDEVGPAEAAYRALCTIGRLTPG
ncbi:MAG TPA: geranylgeranyl reductase family protein [Acidimicrobiales bacterium]